MFFDGIYSEKKDHGSNKFAVAPPIKEMLGMGLVGWLIFVVIAVVLGPDINTDSVHYHFYLADGFLGNPIRRDFMGAGIQGYLSPYAYIPLAWMYRGQWTNLQSILFIASVQSLVVPALWTVSAALAPGHQKKDCCLRLLCIATGLACPLVLSQIGSTFIDLGSSVGIVLASGIMLWAVRGWLSPCWAAVLAGFFCGLSFIFKFTNAPLAILMSVMLLFVGQMNSSSSGGQSHGTSNLFYRSLEFWWLLIRRVLVYGAALGVTCALGMARWSWLLWEEYKNPFFPFFNHFFQSPDFSSVSFSHLRFVPRDIAEFLWRPVLMLDQRSNVFTEISAPDGRPLMLLMVGSSFAFLWLFKRIKRKEEIKEFHNKDSQCVEKIPLICFSVFLALSWITFMAWSGNGRYFMAGFILMGPALVMAVAGIKSLRTRVGIALSMLAVQTVLLFCATYRWSNGEDWEFSSPFISGRVPLALAARPVTYITLEKVLHSQLSLSSHPDSPWINLMGSFSVSPTGPGSNKVLRKLRQSSEIWVLFRSVVNKPSYQFNQFQFDDKKNDEWKEFIHPSKVRLENLKQPMAQFGLHIEDQGCLYEKTQQTMAKRMIGSAEMGYLYCPVIFSESMRIKAIEDNTNDDRQKKIERALDNLEKICPLNLGPKGSSSTNYETGKAVRFYSSTDAKAIVSPEISSNEIKSDAKQFVSLEFYGKTDWVHAGTIDDLVQQKYSPALIRACGTRQIAYERPWERK